MAKSYTTLRNLYGVDTKNTQTANLSYGDEIMNDFHRRLLAKANWPFLHRLRTETTVASTTFVNLPHDIDQLESVFVTVSGTRYNPRPAPSRKFWDELHYSTQTSDVPEYWFVYNGQLGLWPQPQTAGNVISMSGKIRVPDLSMADYTTGTVDVITNASTAVTGASTSWASPMVGRWLRVTETDVAATAGDHEWYEISAVGSATALTLVREYGGTTLATPAGAAYIIGQMPLLPEAFHDLPEIYAAYRYWLKETDDRAGEFAKLLNDGISTLFDTYGFNDLSMVLEEGDDRYPINPNLVISL